MKDYTIKGKDNEKFILNYAITNGNLLVTFANGDIWEVENTPANEKKILEEMKGQVVSDSLDKEKTIKKSAALNKGICVLCGCVGTAFIAMSPVKDPMIYATTLSLLAVGATVPIVKIAKGQSIINDINKQKFMIAASEELNKGALNTALVFGISEETQKVISDRLAESLPVFDLSTADQFSLEDLKKMKENLLKDKYYGFTYPEKEKVRKVK